MKIKSLYLTVASISMCSIGMAAPAWAEDAPPAEAKAGPQLGNFGFDTAGMDKSVAPGDDFYLFANGEWAKNAVIPDDKSNYGMFTALGDLSQVRVREVLDAEKLNTKSKVGNAFASYLDEAAVEKLGLKPIQPWLNKCAA